MVFDVETTGLLAKPNPAKATPPRLHECPYIIQLSFVVYNLRQNRVEEVFDAYIDIPEEVPIVERITEITGITRETIREKGQPIGMALRRFYSAFVKCDCVVAHNLEFDRSMLEIEMSRYVQSMTNASIPVDMEMMSMWTTEFLEQYRLDLYCTMQASIDLCSIMAMTQPRLIASVSYDASGVPVVVQKPASAPRQYKKFPKLSELHQKLFGTVPENLHNSLVDVMVCLRCFLKIRCCIEVSEMAFSRLLKKHVA
jgi:DNA polymerase III epsilon subunit-like protein